MNPFFEKFRKKKRSELLQILNNSADYTDEALIAAKYHLERLEVEIDEGLGEKLEIIKKQKISHKAKEDQWSLSSFIKSFSYRELITYISLSLFFWSIYDILAYYSSEPKLETSYKGFQYGFVPIILIANHIIYAVEHGRTNNYLGRVVNSFSLMLTLLILRAIILSIIGNSNFNIDFTFFILLLVLTVCISIIIETLFWPINKLIKALK